MNISLILREMKEITRQKLLDGNLVKEGYFKQDYIKKVLNARPNQRLNLHYAIMWNMLTFGIWYEIFMSGDVKKPKLDINKM